MTSLRVVTDRAELTGLVPSLVDIHPAVLNAAPGDREDVRARREGFYYAALDTHSENTRMSAAVAETADGQVVGYAFGGLYNGSESLWRDDKGGELLVPEGDRRRAISRATREAWADQPVPHLEDVNIHPDYRGQGLGTRLTRAWSDARPADELYRTGHTTPDNLASLRMERSLGAQVIGIREYGKLFYLAPLGGQSPVEVDRQVAAIQADVPGVGTALAGLGPVGDVTHARPTRQSDPVAAPSFGVHVALSMDQVINKAADQLYER